VLTSKLALKYAGPQVKTTYSIVVVVVVVVVVCF
jgi:hypothetical protein